MKEEKYIKQLSQLKEWKCQPVNLLLLFKMTKFLQITLATETHPAEQLTLKRLCTLNTEQSPINPVCIHRQTGSRIDKQLILLLKTLMRISASQFVICSPKIYDADVKLSFLW